MKYMKQLDSNLSAVPNGTFVILVLADPALKCRAILNRPYGTLYMYKFLA